MLWVKYNRDRNKKGGGMYCPLCDDDGKSEEENLSREDGIIGRDATHSRRWSYGGARLWRVGQRRRERPDRRVDTREILERWRCAPSECWWCDCCIGAGGAA